MFTWIKRLGAGGAMALALGATGLMAAAPALAADAVAAAPAAAAAVAAVPNKGDTAWILVCTAFVVLMTLPGLALFYGGLTRSKNVLSILVQCMVVFSLIAVLWTIMVTALRSRKAVHLLAD